jgi:hypothetical protein
LWLEFLQDEEEGERATWIPIDEKYAKLFNYVYSKNLNPYSAGDGTYQSEEWPEAWTYSDDKPETLVDKVIKKIRNTAGGQTVSAITLRDYGIYVGKHTVRRPRANGVSANRRQLAAPNSASLRFPVGE